MRVLVFVNGILTEYKWLKSLIQDEDRLICADGGTYHCLAADRIPHVVVGDMDSITPETIAELTAAGVTFERHPPAKNETDLELAIDAALRAVTDNPAIAEVLLIGVLGGRLDQMLANLLILTQREWPVPMRIVDQYESAQLVRSGETINLHGQSGEIVSSIPLSPTVSGITYTGLVYPLNDYTMAMGSTRGISNEFAQAEATVTVGQGNLLVIHRHSVQ